MTMVNLAKMKIHPFTYENVMKLGIFQEFNLLEPHIGLGLSTQGLIISIIVIKIKVQQRQFN